MLVPPIQCYTQKKKPGNARSRTTSINPTTFGPPERFLSTLISRFTFVFATGLSTLMTHTSLFAVSMPSKTWEEWLKSWNGEPEREDGPRSTFHHPSVAQSHTGRAATTQSWNYLRVIFSDGLDSAGQTHRNHTTPFPRVALTLAYTRAI